MKDKHTWISRLTKGRAPVEITVTFDPKDDGLAHVEAVFTETRCNALGYARSSRIEQWSDGGWRALGYPGIPPAHEDPYHCAEGLVQILNEVSR